MYIESISHCNLCKSNRYKHIFTKNKYRIVRCLKCNLVFIENPLSNEELSKIYSFKNKYHTKYKSLDMDRAKSFIDYEFKNKYSLIKPYINSLSGNKILDIGCASGLFLKCCNDLGWDCYGVELSEDTSKVARENFGLNVITGQLCKGMFKYNYFDVICLFEVIEHMTNPNECLKIISNILKDDGILIISTPNVGGIFPIISRIFANVVNHWPHPEPPYHLFQFSKRTINKLLKIHNYKIIKFKDDNIPISYSFDLGWAFKSFKYFIYTCLLIPFASLGPFIKMGDAMTIICKKKIK